LDDAGALALAQYCSNLQFLDLDLCRDVSFPILLEVLRRCPIQSLKVPKMCEESSRCIIVQKMCEASETLTNVTVGGAEYNVSLNEMMMKEMMIKELKDLMKEVAHDDSGEGVDIALNYSESDSDSD